jgi:hypothetical protein
MSGDLGNHFRIVKRETRRQFIVQTPTYNNA